MILEGAEHNTGALKAVELLGNLLQVHALVNNQHLIIISLTIMKSGTFGPQEVLASANIPAM